MEIIDKYGYLEDVLCYIEKNILNSRQLSKIAKKAKIKKELLDELSANLKGFSETSFFTMIQEKLEEKHSSATGASGEVRGADIGIETVKNKAFILINFKFDIVIDGEGEDKASIFVKIFSKNNIKLQIV